MTQRLTLLFQIFIGFLINEKYGIYEFIALGIFIFFSEIIDFFLTLNWKNVELYLLLNGSDTA